MRSMELKLTFPHTLCGIAASSAGFLLNVIAATSAATAQCVRLVVSLTETGRSLRLQQNPHDAHTFQLHHTVFASIFYYLYLCQIVDNFYQNFPVCTLENMLSRTINNFCTYNIVFANNYLISNLTRIENTARYWIRIKQACCKIAALKHEAKQ